MMIPEPGKDPLFDQGIYLLMDGINDKTCQGAIEFILTHNLMKPKLKKIQLMINSPGGSVTACLALIDVMKGSKIPIHTVGLGMIASCGLLLFMSGEQGHRVLTPNTSILSHQWSWDPQLNNIGARFYHRVHHRHRHIGMRISCGNKRN